MDNEREPAGCWYLAPFIICCAIPMILTARDMIEAHQHKKALELYGAEILELCVLPEERERSESGKVGGKFIFLSSGPDLENVHVLNTYMRQLDKGQRATGPDDLTNVACVIKDETKLNTVNYSNPTSTEFGSCTRYKRYVRVYVFDIKTGNLIDAHTFDGPTPKRQCPSSVSSSSSERTITGKAPDRQEIINWVVSLRR